MSLVILLSHERSGLLSHALIALRQRQRWGPSVAVSYRVIPGLLYRSTVDTGAGHLWMWRYLCPLHSLWMQAVVVSVLTVANGTPSPNANNTTTPPLEVTDNIRNFFRAI